LRPIHVGRDDVYASGLLAGDHVSDETAAQVRTAVVAALEAQRRAPGTGLAQMADRYGDDRTDDAPEGWRLLEQFVFTDRPTGSMDAERWKTTLDFLCAGRGLERPVSESVYRPQLLGAPAYS
jgi:hypothetical protein